MAYGTKDFLQSVLRELACGAAQGCAYATESNVDAEGYYQSGWTADFARKKVDEVWRDTAAAFRPERKTRVSVAELRDLTARELRDLGFVPWNETLTCIPLWALNYIADGEALTAIDGDTVIKGQDAIDLDVRAGCVAFGFAPPTAA